ncbi:hypothetical protein NEIRO03_1199 [Nematocida sp. AWRm78]|nr:hypothetical protein NEIRO02_1303 [Nematocida sp. AWRm79]KAI5183619.1 hypothetical protein NEIRO03_1199 [Nematocida sp. AWRm78]
MINVFNPPDTDINIDTMSHTLVNTEYTLANLSLIIVIWLKKSISITLILIGIFSGYTFLTLLYNANVMVFVPAISLCLSFMLMILIPSSHPKENKEVHTEKESISILFLIFLLIPCVCINIPEMFFVLTNHLSTTNEYFIILLSHAVFYILSLLHIPNEFNTFLRILPSIFALLAITEYKLSPLYQIKIFKHKITISSALAALTACISLIYYVTTIYLPDISRVFYVYN